MAQTWLQIGDIPPSRITPWMRQFIEAKAEAGNSLLFFRMGDFYELFFDDAIEASELLGLTLTSRSKEERIPMAGVPVKTVDAYLAKAIQKGRTVAVCEQMEDPRDAKGIVKRQVVRTVTPGTILEPNLLDDTRNNFLGAVALNGSSAGFAFLDVSTGEFIAAQSEGAGARVALDELARLMPAEVLYPETLDAARLRDLSARFPDITFTKRASFQFDEVAAAELLLRHFALGTLKGLGLDTAPLAVACAGAALAYAAQTQRDNMPRVRPPRRYNPAGYVVLDANTQRNLELVQSLGDKSRRGTLLAVLDRTRTSMGARKLRQWILHPLLDVAAIGQRLNGVECFFDRAEVRLQLRDALKGVADLERLMGRITARSGNARDVKALGVSLGHVPCLRAAIAPLDADIVQQIYAQMDDLCDVAQWIESAICDAPPLAVQEGGIFKDGHDPELDRLRNLVRGGKDWIATLQREEAARTGIPNLKVGYNRIFGYYIEVSKGNVHLVPDDYERKQTLVNAERYITPGLKSREEEIVTAQERMQKLEYELFVQFRERVAGEAARIQQTADAIATLDVLQSLADIAVTKNYCKPQVDAGGEIIIRDGRHPVVEDLMKSTEFVPNDTKLTAEKARLQIVTGPNMAGKSTYLRQVALIALMAQIGSYVPAAQARVGAVDRIFTRVGASDNLVRGESTFMVEMIETATILNTATERSLLVLDEIGRGTSTFDGISIAWSVAEHIHDRIGAKTLFATHYHELTELGEKLEHAKNLNVAVREWGDKVVFLYRIVEGGADHSYGIQVARLAGLPDSVIRRAREILESLEAGNPAQVGLPQQMYLFGAMPISEPSAVEQELEAIDPDTLSPREAHELVYHLKHLLNRPRRG